MPDDTSEGPHINKGKLTTAPGCATQPAMRNRAIIFLGDGMADEPNPHFGGKTALQAAHTPAMDRIAAQGRSGTLLTLPDAFPTSSEVANMSVLGCDLESEYSGRGPLEAAGRNIALTPRDIAFRLNLTTAKNGILADYSGGHIAQPDAEALIDCLDRAFGIDTVRIRSGVSYRNLLILTGPRFSDQVHTEKPDDNVGNPIAEHLPRSSDPRADATAQLLQRLIRESTPILEASPTNIRLAAEGKPMANSVWPWYGGYARSMRRLKDKFGITGAVISAVDVIVGIGRSIGMDVISVPGATGFVDTNYEGKADAAIQAIKDHDFVYVHVEGIDEAGHLQDAEMKRKAIEDFESLLVGRVLDAIGDDVTVAVLPDHPVPLSLGKHTRTPVPVAVRIPAQEPDGVHTYDEAACLNGSLGAMVQGDLMQLLFGPPRGA